ncbi:MAG: YfiR family protein [bacterium]|nr:YfiR family protein [bacterium]
MAAALSLALCLPGSSGPRQVEVGEYQLKAAFLAHFARFIDWPEGSALATADTFQICIIGRDPFLGTIDRTVADKTVYGREFLVARHDGDADISACHIVFVGSSDTEEIRKVLSRADSLPVLTVGDADRFVRLGGIIGFLVDGNRVRFEINTKAAKQAELRISSKLLSLARVARNQPGS